MRLEMVVIDPQNDFCAPPGYLHPGHPGGSLYVPNAERSIERLAGVVDRLGSKLIAIHVTLDSHRVVDVAHPIHWRDSGGSHALEATLGYGKRLAAGSSPAGASSTASHYRPLRLLNMPPGQPNGRLTPG